MAPRFPSLQEKEALYESALEKLELALVEDPANVLALRQCGLASLDLALTLRDASPKQHRQHLQARLPPMKASYPCVLNPVSVLPHILGSFPCHFYDLTPQYLTVPV